MAKKNNDDLFGGLDSIADELFGKKSAKEKKESVSQPKKAAPARQSAAKPQKPASNQTSAPDKSQMFGGLDSIADELFGKSKVQKPQSGDITALDSMTIEDLDKIISSSKDKSDTSMSKKSSGSGKQTKKFAETLKKEEPTSKETDDEIDDSIFGDFDIPDSIPASELKSSSAKQSTASQGESAKKAASPAKKIERGESVETFVARLGSSNGKDFSVDLSGKDNLLLVDGKSYGVLTDSVILSASIRYSPENLEIVVFDFESKNSSQFLEFTDGGKNYVPHVKKIKFISSDGFPVLDCLDEVETEEKTRDEFFDKHGYGNYSDYIADCKRKSEVAEMKRIMYVFYNADKPFGTSDDPLSSLIRSKFELISMKAKNYGITVVAACSSVSQLNEEVKDSFSSKITYDSDKKGFYSDEFYSSEVQLDDITDDLIELKVKVIKNKFGGYKNLQIIEEV